MKMQICFWIKKNSDLHLRKMQICFIWRKIQICISERCRSVLFEEEFRSVSKKDVDLLYFEEKKERVEYMQIFKTKKQIISTMNESRTYFHELN